MSGVRPASASIIWSDGFESGNFSAWSATSGGWTVVTSTLAAHSGLKGADVKGASLANGDMLAVSVSSAGSENLHWQYWFKVRDALESADSVFAEWTANGADWQTLTQYTNVATGDWQFADFTLPIGANNNPNLGFRFRATLGSATDRMNFDDAALSGTPIAAVPEPSSLLGLGVSASLLFFRRRK